MLTLLKIANQYFCNTTDLIMLDSYFSARSNEKIIDWHADIPLDLPSNPTNIGNGKDH